MTETRRALVTGGAGFIGSHLTDALLERGWEVTVYDNFVSGKRAFLEGADIELIEADLLDADRVLEATEGCELVVHSAADPDVRVGVEEAERHFEQNVVTTQNVIEACRRTGVEDLLFMSTSTVYGEVDIFPTPLDYGPMKPISTYGASKAACEAIISGHAHTFDFNSCIYRFANILGPRLTHGVIYDFVHKLRATPERLEILGDGKQQKSYCHIDDMVDAVLTLYDQEDRDRAEIVNVGTESWTTVTRIGEIVVDALGLDDVTFDYTGGVDGGRGWKGDIKKMRLEIEGLKKIGWEPKYTSDEAVQVTAEWMAANT